MAKSENIKRDLDKFNNIKSRTKENNRKSSQILKKMAHDGAISTKIAMHNSFIALVYIMIMLIVAVATTQVAYAGVALSIGYAGAAALETVADMLTMYVTIAMVCGVILFFTFKIENLLIKAMSDRFWHYDHKNDAIDKGRVWHKKHDGLDETIEIVNNK